VHLPSNYFVAAVAFFVFGVGIALLLRAAFPRRRAKGINAYWTKRTPFSDVPQERLGLISGATYFWLGLSVTLWGFLMLLRTTISFVPDHVTDLAAAAIIIVFFWRRWADSKTSPS
jgi:hypothetical protein